MCGGDSNSDNLLETPLASRHVALGAKMIGFGGWNMPVQYTTIIDEHTCTRTKAGLFDICHMGEYIVSGADAKRFLSYMLVGDLNKIEPSKAMYSVLCYENGTTVDDLFVYCLADNEYMLVVNACNATKDLEWLQKHSDSFDVGITDISSETGKIDVQGPTSAAIMTAMGVAQLPERFHYIETTIANIPVKLSRTGYTGEDGFELYCDSKDVGALWDAVLAAGKPHGLQPVGLGARDTLRTEACYSLYGHEINDTITPVEGGIGWTVAVDKEDFIGKSVLAAQKAGESTRKTIAFELIDRGVARDTYPVLFEGTDIGVVTSGTFSPTYKKSLGMALVSKSVPKDAEIDILIRNKKYKARVVKRPIYPYCGGTNGKPN